MGKIINARAIHVDEPEDNMESSPLIKTPGPAIKNSQPARVSTADSLPSIKKLSGLSDPLRVFISGKLLYFYLP